MLERFYGLIYGVRRPLALLSKSDLVQPRLPNLDRRSLRVATLYFRWKSCGSTWTAPRSAV